MVEKTKTEDVAEVTPEPTPAVVNLETLKAQMATAISSGNDAEMIKISKLILKEKSSVEKAEADRLKAEAEALAGVREALAASLSASIITPELTESLLAVKCKSFTVTVPHNEISGTGKLDANGTVKVSGAIVLNVPTVKKSGGGGGGGTGVTVASQTGMPRGKLIETYATDEEKAAIAKARQDAIERGGNPNSSGWSAEKPVVKAILARNPELVKH